MQIYLQDPSLGDSEREKSEREVSSDITDLSRTINNLYTLAEKENRNRRAQFISKVRSLEAKSNSLRYSHSIHRHHHIRGSSLPYCNAFFPLISIAIRNCDFHHPLNVDSLKLSAQLWWQFGFGLLDRMWNGTWAANTADVERPTLDENCWEPGPKLAWLLPIRTKEIPWKGQLIESMKSAKSGLARSFHCRNKGQEWR